MKKRVIILLGLAVLITVSVASSIFLIKNEAYTVDRLTDELITAADTKDARKLIVVAHPDDEVLWGGGHLMEGGYFVVCITNGRNKVRSEEFRRVVEASGNSGIILNYPDKVLSKRDDWKKVGKGIRSDLEKIMDYKNWDMVVTHNKEGEYGHQHHIYTNRFVTDIANKYGSELWYFGKYYDDAGVVEAKPGLTPITPEQLAFKLKLEELYKSQAKTVKNLSQMNEYEMWTRCAE